MVDRDNASYFKFLGRSLNPNKHIPGPRQQKPSPNLLSKRTTVQNKKLLGVQRSENYKLYNSNRLYEEEKHPEIDSEISQNDHDDFSMELHRLNKQS